MSNRHATYLVACLTDTPQISGVSVHMWRVWQTRHKAFFPFPATKVLSPSKKFLTLSLSLSLSHDAGRTPTLSSLSSLTQSLSCLISHSAHTKAAPNANSPAMPTPDHLRQRGPAPPTPKSIWPSPPRLVHFFFLFSFQLYIYICVCVCVCGIYVKYIYCFMLCFNFWYLLLFGFLFWIVDVVVLLGFLFLLLTCWLLQFLHKYRLSRCNKCVWKVTLLFKVFFLCFYIKKKIV